ncbi:MAG: zinc-ribbon domain-containing protein [Acidobacteriota bacterium]|nr:zinc-ribbon domain-containing protein [Blastocatellia bacterium]MDW8412660.1 zinc-ribbon domain-containing protein [Acidobacteriota bacterium]
MNTTCPQCGFDVFIDDTQVPPYAFNIECPRCRKTITVTPPPKPQPSLRVGEQTRTQYMGSPATSSFSSSDGTATPSDPMQMMMQLMQMMMAGMGAPQSGAKDKNFMASWQRKRAVICCADANQRSVIEQVLGEAGVETEVAQSSGQAIEIMQDHKVDYVILDPQFDAARQGGIAVLRYVNSLMPKYRRRIYVVLVSPQVKTLDTYMAFLNCVNLTVNADDVESLPGILQKSLKDFNELYRPLYEAASMTPL